MNTTEVKIIKALIISAIMYGVGFLIFKSPDVRDWKPSILFHAMLVATIFLIYVNTSNTKR